jgi:GntR family transcriptional regulator, transcriptional repressor for pyruvate dehydrogenase complex
MPGPMSTANMVVRGNLTDQVAAQITADISAQAISPGGRLPTENALCARFGVSRTVVREAIARLKSEGLVASRQGSGVFVLAENPQRPFRLTSNLSDSSDEILQVAELRMAFDVEAASLAARRRTQDQLRRLRAALDQMAAAVRDGANGVEADVAFHRCVAEATGNPHYVAFMSYLIQFLRKGVRISRERTLKRPGLGEKVQLEHEAIFRAIQARDPDAAAAAARRHVRGTMRRLSLSLAV